MLWQQDDYIFTDTSYGSTIFLTPTVMATKGYYGDNPKEWLCIYTEGLNITFENGNIIIIGNVNRIPDTKQTFNFNWRLGEESLTDPKHKSEIVIDGYELKSFLNENKKSKTSSYPKIEVSETAATGETSLARDITPPRYNYTMMIVEANP